MELLYAVSSKYKLHSELQSEDFGLGQQKFALCALSCKNILAFTTKIVLHNDSKFWGSHVYVADLNTPWHSDRVTSKIENVTALEWDQIGEKLLVATYSGVVEVWRNRQHVFNDWMCIASITLPHGPIISAAFFHNGKKIRSFSEKNDEVIYSDKFHDECFKPTLRGFGGRPIEGCIVVCSSGAIAVTLLPSEITMNNSCVMMPFPLVFNNAVLGSCLQRVITADIGYAESGEILVAVSREMFGTLVEVFRVSVNQSNNNCSLKVYRLCRSQLSHPGSRKGVVRYIVHLKFLCREDPTSVVVAFDTASREAVMSQDKDKSTNKELFGNLGMMGGGGVEIWVLGEVEKTQYIYTIFQQYFPYSPSITTKTIDFIFKSHYKTKYWVVCVTITKHYLPSYILVLLTDGTLLCLDSESLLLVTSLSLSHKTQNELCNFNQSTNPYLYMDTSFMGRLLVVSDSLGHLSVYRIPSTSHIKVEDEMSLVVRLLEYCLITGLDYWDLLISLRPDVVDEVVNRLSSAFTRQLEFVQQYYFQRFLIMKASLYKLTVDGIKKAVDLTTLQKLNSISTVFKSLIRPTSISTSEEWSKEIFPGLMSSPEFNIDLAVIHYTAKGFEADDEFVFFLPPLIQWVLHLSIDLINQLPTRDEYYGSNDSLVKTFSPYCTEYVLIKDVHALQTICELLLIIRIWSKQKINLRPVSLSYYNLDLLAIMFELLMKLALSSKFDDTMLDECCEFREIIMAPNHIQLPCIIAIASPDFFSCKLPLILEYGTEPENLKLSSDYHKQEYCEQTFDCISNRYLGKWPLAVKQCGRCGGKTQSKSMSRSLAIMGWETRWARSCYCGGLWYMRNAL